MVGEHPDVLNPLTQPRHMQFDYVDPVEQILAELPPVNQLPQVLVGGAQNPYINRNFLVRSPTGRTDFS